MFNPFLRLFFTRLHQMQTSFFWWTCWCDFERKGSAKTQRKANHIYNPEGCKRHTHRDSPDRRTSLDISTDLIYNLISKSKGSLTSRVLHYVQIGGIIGICLISNGFLFDS